MRHNNRKLNFPKPAILESENTLNDLEDIVFSGNKKLIKDRIFKGKRTEGGKDFFDVRIVLAEIFFNKCAYCESKEHKPEVEHFRPKGRVSGENHSGYFWLCYEWSNLLPACHFCNTENGKRDKFPIQGIRVSAPRFLDGKLDYSKMLANASPLIHEQPFLLNPEIDFPDNSTYFSFKNNGEINGIDAAKRGEKTIEICDLNRQNLMERKQEKVIDLLFDTIQLILDAHFESTLISSTAVQQMLFLVFEGLQAKQTPTEEFSLYHKFVFEKFDQILVPLFPQNRQATISNAFRLFKENIQPS